MDKPPTHPSPALGVVATDHDHVGRHTQISQGAMEANCLVGLVLNLWLNHEKVDVAARVGLSASVRTKQDHLGIRGSRSQAAGRLVDQGLVNYLHGTKA